MLDPDKGRARIRREGEALIVEIKPERGLFLIGFLGFWLCGWAFGWIMAVGFLIHGGLGAGTAFLMFWLAAWTIGGILAIAIFLWVLAGRETIRFTTTNVDIIREIPVWRKVTTCRFDALGKMRLAPNDELSRQQQISFWLNKEAGRIKINYGVHTLGFGLGLDDAEAQKLVDTIGAVFPELTA